MKTIALGVLAFRGGCPVTEAYLRALQMRGLKPAVILAIDYVGESARAAKLERVLGTTLAANLMRRWRNRSARIAPELVRILQADRVFKLNPGSEPRFEDFADRVIHLTVKNYSDPLLRQAMSACGASVFLYCSGGRVPASVFNDGFKILHIHPGVVPHVKGSDGLLWSIVTRGRPGASCFYMDAGIDTGRMIATAEYPLPQWRGLRVDPELLYNALIYCYDPHLRASLLIEVLEGIGRKHSLSSLPAIEQPHKGGHCYKMHPILRARVLSRLCA